MITRLRYPKGYQFFDANGSPLALGNLYYYVAGTTTLQDTYSDSAGTVTNTNPLVLDGSGRLSADVYLGSAANYKEVLTTASATVSPWPDDNIPYATQPDWNATSGPNQILNKPVLAAVAISGSYTDLSNKLNPFGGDAGSGGTSGIVPAPAAGDAVANKFLSAGGGWATPPGASGSAATNLNITEAASSVAIGSSTGTGITIPAATSAAAGVLDSARAAKIDGLAVVASSGSYADLANKPGDLTGATAGAAGLAGFAPPPAAGQQGLFLRGDATWATPTGSSVTNLTASETANSVLVASSTGTGATIPAATSTAAGVLDASRAAKIDGLAAVAASGSYTDLSNRPALANVATSGSYTDLSNQPAIPAAQVNADWNAASGIAQILNKPALATVATSGSYSDLSDKPSIPAIPGALSGQNIDSVTRLGINTVDTNNALSVNAPSVLFSNSGDMRATISKGATANTAAFNFQDNFSTRVQFGLLGNDNFTVSASPDGSTFNSAIVATTAGAVSFPNTGGFAGDSGSGGGSGLVPAPAAGTAAAGKYLKADGTWSIPPGTAQSNSDWNASSGVAQILNKPALAAVATSGSYTDLSNTPSIPAAQVSSDWNASSGIAQILNKPALATVATSGSYNDLSNKPAAQINSDWNASSGVAQILNKPSIPAAQVNSDWNASTGIAQILNKPTLAAVAASGSYNDLLNVPTQSARLDSIGSTQGNVLYRGASGWAVLAPGASGQFLQCQGPSANPQWATVSASNGWTVANSSNYGFGTSALSAISTGTYNLAQGYQAGAALTGGNYGIAIGYKAMAAQTSFAPSQLDPSGVQTNIAIGPNALLTTQTSWGNVAIGRGVLQNLASNSSTSQFLPNNFNVGVGDLALNSVTTGSENMAFGNNAGLNITTGTVNTAVGSEPLKLCTTGSANSAFGVSALQGVTTGGYNTGIGQNAGGLAADPSATSTGSYDTYLGAAAANYSVILATNGTTASGNNVLHFASVPATVVVGMQVADTTATSVIPAGTAVTATTGTAVTLSANVTGSGVGSGDSITFYGIAKQLVTSAATASGTTLTFATGVPGYIVPGMSVSDLTTSSVIPANTTVSAVGATTITLSQAVTGGGVLSGDSILFSGSQYTYMTVIGAGAQGARSHTVYLGGSAENVVIGGPAVATNAGLSIGSSGLARAAINIAQNAPNTGAAVNGDIWRDYSDNLWAQLNGTAVQLNISYRFTPSGNNGGNFFSGYQAGNLTMTGGSSYMASQNTLVGTTTGNSITTGYQNSTLGFNAGKALTSGANNTLIGNNAGLKIDVGNNSTIVGSISGANLAGSGGSATILGYNSGTALTTGTDNVICGPGSGNALTTTFGCTILGSGAGTGVTGSTNTVIGYQCGGGLTSGTGNTIVGYGLGSLGNPSNTLILGAGGVQLLAADGTTVRPQKPLKLPAYTVSGLPSASTAGAGTEAWVTDSTLAFNGTNLGSTASGGGSYGSRVISNGTNWLIG